MLGIGAPADPRKMFVLLAGCIFTLSFLYFAVTGCLERMRVSDLSSKPILITGCDMGFGFDLTLKCVSEGIPVFAGCLTEQVHCGLRLVVSGLHVMVNNAGINGHATVDDWLVAEDCQAIWEGNTLGVIRVTHAFKPFLKRVKGRRVTMASIMGRVALPGVGP